MDEEIRKKLRKEFVKGVEHLMKKGMKFTDKFEEGTIIVTNREEDYDLDNNSIFILEGCKSYPVDEVCEDCKHKLVMSVASYAMLKRARKKKVKVKIKCSPCFMKFLKKMEKKETKQKQQTKL